MTRPSTYLVIFLLSVHVVAGLAAGAGADDVMGVSTENIQSDEVAGEAEDMENTNPSNTDGTLFGMIWTTFSDTLYGVLTTINPGLAMLGSAGVPANYINAFGLITSAVIGFDILSYLRGWGL
jgi:hypothetical protein